MKIFGQFAVITIALLTGLALLVWGVSALVYYPWANDCKDAGHSVQEYGYGIPMFTSTYVCVNADGNIVDWL